MKLYRNPDTSQWPELVQRPYTDNRAVLASVQQILAQVKEEGDNAIRRLARQFDGVELDAFEVGKQEMDMAAQALSPEIRKAILQAKANIETFHKSQLQQQGKMETMPGITCWRKSVGIEKVGLYVPGGTAPLFSTVLMLAVPAVLAGCNEIVLCTPCNREGNVHPAVLFAAQVTGVSRIFKAGGAQAIGAMAYGTQTIPAVSKIFGPGNQYVTAAKQLVQMEGAAIDMPAGPSEVCILADSTANPRFIAADLLSQAEHGADSQVFLVSTSEELVGACLQELDIQLAVLPRKDLAAKALHNSKAVVLPDIETALQLVNAYAGEHLIISCANAPAVAEKVVNAGSVFIGAYSPESAGDYASGTNHTLPTNGFARAYSGVSVDSFVKKITFQELSQDGLRNIATTVIDMAEAEGLQAHANAVRVRMK